MVTHLPTILPTQQRCRYNNKQMNVALAVFLQSVLFVRLPSFIQLLYDVSQPAMYVFIIRSDYLSYECNNRSVRMFIYEHKVGVSRHSSILPVLGIHWGTTFT